MSKELEAYKAVLAHLDSAFERRDPERIAYWIKKVSHHHIPPCKERREDKPHPLYQVLLDKHHNFSKRVIKHMEKLGMLHPNIISNNPNTPVDVVKSILKEIKQQQSIGDK